MDYLAKIFRRLSIENVAVHIVGLVISMAIIWGVSYLILVTFSIQNGTLEPTPVVAPIIVSKIQHASTTATSTKKTVTASSTATSTKGKK